MFARNFFLVVCILMIFYVRSNMGAATGGSDDDSTNYKTCNSGLGKCVPFLLCKETFEGVKNAGDAKSTIDSECGVTYELCCSINSIKESMD